MYYTVAIKSDGTLWAWGDNYAGQLGYGSNVNRTVPTQEYTQSTNWSSVSAGDNHTVAIKSDGTLWAWGNNMYGKLGNGEINSFVDTYIPTQEITQSTNWSSVSAGGAHTVAIKSDGTLWAWGDNYAGQLGDGTQELTIVPVQESTSSTNWSSVSVGSAHTVAIKSDDTLWVWGHYRDGRLGLGEGTTTYIVVPTQNSISGNSWSSVSSKSSHTIAIKADGTLWGWGKNTYGVLGDETEDSSWVPIQESSSATNWSSVNAGLFHTVTIKTDGTIWSWGSGLYGKFGDGNALSKSLVPIQEYTQSTNWSSVSAGNSHTLAIKSDGTLWAWGENNYGELGIGSNAYEQTFDKYIPTQIQPRQP